MVHEEWKAAKNEPNAVAGVNRVFCREALKEAQRMKRKSIGWLILILVLSLSTVALGVCRTEVEDNNSAAFADRVADLPGSGCIDGTIGVVGDIDYYFFDLSSARWVTIETITNEDTEITLLDADGNFIASNDDIALGVISSSIEKYLYPGRYYVLVWEHGDDNVIYSYTLNVYSEGCATEVEDNDSLGLADHLGQMPGTACVTGTIGVVGDLDVFSLTATEATTLTISTITNEDTEILLMDESGTVLAVNDDYVVGEYWSWIERDVLPGTYYIIVHEHDDDNVIYDYTLSVLGTSCISEIEPNDESVLADAMGAVPGNLCAMGSIDPIGDLDYYTFTVSTATTVTISTETSGDTRIALFDEIGNILAENDDVSVTDTSSWISTNLLAGTYYVGVRQFANSDWIPSYTLTVTGD